MKNTKSLLALFLACMMVVSCFVVTPVTAEDTGVWDEWDGSSDDDSWKTPDDAGVYHITSAEQFANLAKEINANLTASANLYQGKTIVLDVNIRLNSEDDIANFANWSTSAPARVWEPIGTYDSANSIFHSFNGTFDGQGHTISGMYVPAQTHAGNRCALFGIVGELVTIKNLNLTYSYSKGGGNGVALIAGQMANTHSNKPDQTAFQNVTVSNCYLEGTGSSGTGVILGRTAGLVGQVLVFDGCTVKDSTIKASGFAGGIFGFHGSSDLTGLTFKNCDLLDNTINVKESSGGIMGGSATLSGKYAQTITIDNCTVDQTLNATANNNGGLVGYANSPFTKMIIKNTSVAGTIHTLQNTGIFVGRYGTGAAQADVEIEVTNCTSTASLYSDVGDEATKGQCNGLVIGLFQAKDGTNIKSITIDGLTASGTIDLTNRNGTQGGMFGSIGPAVTNVDIRNVDSELEIKTVGYSGGIFGKTPAITSLNISNVNIGGSITSTGSYAAGLVAYVESPIGSISIDSAIVSATIDGGTYVGGMIGRVQGATPSIVITNSISKAQVTSTYYTGGFIADFDTATYDITFDTCAFLGSVSSTANRVGGFVGDVSHNSTSQYISFNNCYFNGSVSGADQIGAFVGNVSNENSNVSLKNSLAYGTITATGADVGVMAGTIGTDDEHHNNYSNHLTVDGLYYDITFDGASPRLGSFRGFKDCKVYEGEDCTTDAFTTCVFYTPNADATSTELGSSLTPNSIAKSGDANDELILSIQQALGTLPEKLFAADVWEGDIADGFEKGTGTAEDPYVIKTAAQLAYFGAQVTAGTNYKDQYVVLGANIQLNSDDDLANFNNWATSAPALEWTPIGTVDSKAFAGTFDGDGYAISGMYIDSDNYGALFNCTSAATIKNLVVKTAYVKVAGSAASILVAYAKTSTTTFDNVTVSNSELIGVSGGTGAFIGKSGGMNATFNDCSITGTSITASGSVGGFYGYHSGSGASYDVVFDGCYSNATITSTASRVGGLVGEFNNAKNIKVYNTVQEGAITGTEAVGGLVGRMNNEKSSGDTLSKGLEDIIIEDTTVGGSISGSHWIAGFVAVAYAPAKNISVDGCTVSATINESGSSSAAGMFAMLSRSSQADHLATVTESITITNSEVTGSITTVKGPVGGLLGNIGTKNPVEKITIKDTVVSATISGYGGDGTSAAGFISMTNAADIEIINCGITGDISTNRNYSYSAGFIGDIRNQSDVLFEGCYNTGTLTIGTTANASRTGGWLAHYDPAEANEAVGSITFRNCYSTMDVKGTDYVGGLVGQIWPDDITLTVENTVLLGNVEAYSKFDGHGIILGYNSTKNTNSFVTIKNVYYNTDTTTGIARLALFNGDNPVASGYTFYTPDADTTSGLTKQPDLAILGFVESMKNIKNTDGSTPAWFSLKHTCESVDFAEGNTYGDVADTFTLACQKPGCDHFHIEKLGAKFGASIRTGSNAGLRFGFRFNSDLVNTEDVNVGILVIPTDLLTGELTVDTAKVQNVKAATCFPEGSKYYADGAYSFAGVLTGIPTGSFDREITARGYIVIDGVTYYTETAATTYRAIAEQAGVTIAE